MFYVATVRYAEGDEGSTILGIYSTYQEAKDILNIYKRRATFEILEIQHVTRNMQPEDLTVIRDHVDENGDEFIKVNGTVHESQSEYVSNEKLSSHTLFHLELDGSKILSMSEEGNPKDKVIKEWLESLNKDVEHGLNFKY